MRIKNSIISALAILVAGSFVITSCSKDKYTSKPQLKFKSADNYDVPYGGLIVMKVEFTDKEGDVTDSIFIESITTKCAGSNRVAPYRLPQFPATSNLKGEFTITYENGTNNLGIATWTTGGGCPWPDTTTFKFWVKDKAGNVSDTITTDKPVIIQKN